MNSSQSVAITPIFNPFDDVADYVSVNGELYFLLPETQLYDLKRIYGTLQFIHFSLLNPQLEINLSHLQNTLEFPLLNLHKVLNSINSFKF